MELSDGHLEDLRNHYADGYFMGREDERARITTLVKLDLLLSEAIKERVTDLIRGGKDES
jgi:hypothetical protein